MNEDELVANLFRINQTKQKLLKDNVQGDKEAKDVHYEVGKKVRKAIADIGGTIPEEMPTPKKNLKELEKEFPFWILEECSKENNSDLYGIIDNDKLIGMCYLVNCSNAYYLMYLAVEPNLRNQNYGSRILMDLKEKYKVLFLSIDSPVDNISVRRKNFYLRNGFYDTNKFYEDTGINYEYEITDDIMKMRYTNMTNNYKLFEVMSNTFNIGLVNLKNKHKK